MSWRRFQRDNPAAMNTLRFSTVGRPALHRCAEPRAPELRPTIPSSTHRRKRKRQPPSRRPGTFARQRLGRGRRQELSRYRPSEIPAFELLLNRFDHYAVDSASLRIAAVKLPRQSAPQMGRRTTMLSPPINSCIPIKAPFIKGSRAPRGWISGNPRPIPLPAACSGNTPARPRGLPSTIKSRAASPEISSASRCFAWRACCWKAAPTDEPGPVAQNRRRHHLPFPGIESLGLRRSLRRACFAATIRPSTRASILAQA